MSDIPYDGPYGLDEWIHHHVRRTPEATAIINGARTLTYKQLDDWANHLTMKLSAWNLRREEPVSILAPMGDSHIAAQLAVIRLGGSCVPLDVRFPDKRIHDLLRPLGTRLVITTESLKHRVNFFQTMIIPDSLPAEIPITRWQDIPYPVRSNGNHRTHVLHTSGTTGLPKPVEIMSKGITRVSFNTSGLAMKSTDRMAQVAAPSFDAALIEVWGTLALGATVVVLSQDRVIDPYALVESITQHRITGMILTTALLNHVVSVIPTAFSELEWLMSGGEKANANVFKAILENGPPKALINAYGPTENSCIVSYHRVTIDDCNNGDIPIGLPLDETTCFILDETMQPVSGMDVGRLYVAGNGVARGYYGREEANRKSFLDIPGLIPDSPETVTRVYDTGDLARRRSSDGAMEFFGRADSQIKMRGYRVEPGEIESVLLKSNMLQAVYATSVLREGKDMYLVAFIIPKEGFPSILSVLGEYMQRTLPSYMIPRIDVVEEFPFTFHGKVDGRVLVEAHTKKADEIEAKSLASKTFAEDDTITWLTNQWISLLGVGSITDDTDFFELGGSSLQAAVLIVQIRRRFGKRITIRDIYDNPTCFGLSRLIEDIKHDNSATAGSQVDLMLDDTKLSHHIRLSNASIPDWTSPDEGHVFMTGATGFFGAHMVRQLIDQSYIKTVHCLVRGTDDASGQARLFEALEKYGLNDSCNLHKIVAVPGDLCRSRFGLSSATWDSLSECMSAVFHFAAHVNYIEHYDKHRDANVLGTVTALELAAAGRTKSVHYTSTAAISGPARHFGGFDTVFETDHPQRFGDWIKYDIGYTQSKWVTEHLIQDVISKGLPVILYRPGFMMGTSKSGNGNNSDFMARLFLGCIQIGCRPVLPRQTKSLVPVDFCTSAVLHISSNPSNYGQTFHLTPQSPSDDIDLEEIWSWLAQHGYALRSVSYKDWLDSLTQESGLLSNPLLPLLPALQEPVQGNLTRWELWNNMALFETTNTKAALLDCPEMVDSRFSFDDLGRHLQDWSKKGLILKAKA